MGINNFFQYHSMRFVICFSLCFALLLISSKTEAAAAAAAGYMYLNVYQLPFDPPHYTQYMARFFLGSPTQEVSLILDLTTDLIWLMCGVKPDESMPPIPPNDTMPSGDPIPLHLRMDLSYDFSSTSYSPLFCDAAFCPPDFQHHLDNCNNVTLCAKQGGISDGDAQVTYDAYLSMDTLNMTNNYRDILFACTPFQQDFWYAYIAGGVLGLGRGNLSFVTQLGYLYDYQFSYCLPSNPNSPGYFALGKGTISNSPLAYTPLIDDPSLYIIKMISITVDGTPILIDSSNSKTTIDPGTPFTSLPPEAYQNIRERFLSLNNNTHQLYDDKQGYYSPLDLCFSNGIVPIEAPTVEITFARDAIVALPDSAIIYADEVVSCLGFKVSTGSDNTFGGLQHVGKDVLFDLGNKIVGFRQNIDCGGYV